MKNTIVRILKVLFVFIFSVSLIFCGAAYLFFKQTISETSLTVLEEKLSHKNDPYTIQELDKPSILESDSVVNVNEWEAFHLFSYDKKTFNEYSQDLRKQNFITPLNKDLIQINRDITNATLIVNDCKEVYCFQQHFPFEFIPSIFWKGLIGIEDQRYLDHHGVDVKSILRAMVTNLKHGRFEQGGSTISQQLVKNLFFTSEKTFSRKIKELIVSLYVESKFEKEKILEAYLNEVYWGVVQGIKLKGLAASSMYYFGKKPMDITPFEGTILISMLKGPGLYSPLKKIEKLKERAEVVFKKLVSDGMITSDEKEVWKNEDWSKWQAFIQKNEQHKYYQNIWKATNDKDRNLLDFEKFVLLQKVSETLSSVKEKLKSDFYKNISVKVILGPMNENKDFSYYSRIERNKEKALNEEKHQVGSSIKPILYSIFQEFGKKLSDKVSMAEITIPLKSGDWSPKEAHNSAESEMTLSDALLKSYNRPVIRIASEIGFDKIEEKATTYFPEIKKPLAEFPSELLGSMEMSVKDLRETYRAFIKKECAKINNKELNPDDSVLYALSDPNKTTVEHSVDMIMKNLRFFGKTGTTNNGYDNWYMAFDGLNLTTIWVGNEGSRADKKSLGLYGSTTSFSIFQSYYRDRGRRFIQFGCSSI